MRSRIETTLTLNGFIHQVHHWTVYWDWENKSWSFYLCTTSLVGGSFQPLWSYDLGWCPYYKDPNYKQISFNKIKSKMVIETWLHASTCGVTWPRVAGYRSHDPYFRTFTWKNGFIRKSHSDLVSISSHDKYHLFSIPSTIRCSMYNRVIYYNNNVTVLTWLDLVRKGPCRAQTFVLDRKHKLDYKT